MRSTRWILLPTTLLLASLLGGCLGGGDDSSNVVFTATDASKVGDGIPSSSHERALLVFGGPDGCSDGTTVALNPEPGGIAQSICGVAMADTAGNPIVVYRGIPYADTTAGDNRWVDPKPPLEPVVRAVEYGHVCPQGKAADFDPVQMSEDCLYVNVWTPQTAMGGGSKLTVMVFIHGGAFVSGSGGSAAGDASGKLNLYDGRQFLATAHAQKQDIVFVTMNYRLGALGFLAGDKLGLAGNFGIKDQTKALEWVQRNIASFGGDPARVMVFGESAGAQSTALHLTITANNHQKLFQRAALESNYGMSYMSLGQAQLKADAFAKATSCKDAPDVMKCLRAVQLASTTTDATILGQQTAKDGGWSKENIACVGMQAFLPWNPVIDTKFIVDDPINLPITKPVIVGSNLSEAIPFFAAMTEKQSEDAYFALTNFLFGVSAAADIDVKYTAAYPKAPFQQKLDQLVTDYMWTCFNRQFARQARKNVLDVYRYHDVHHGSFSVWGNTSVTGQACSTSPNVCHADELPFVFGNPTNSQFTVQTFTPDEISMSTALQQYWIQLASGSGSPNGAAAMTKWTQDSDLLPHYLRVQAPASALSMQSGSQLESQAFCDFWDGIGYTVTAKYTACIGN